MVNNKGIPYFLIIAAGFIWGATFSLTIIASSGEASPTLLVTIQSVISCVLFWAFCKISGVRPFKLAHLKHYLVLSAVGIIIPNSVYFSAAPHLSAGILSITISTVPMFTYLIMWLMKFESAKGSRIAGIVLGMIAIVFLVVPDQGLASSDASLWIIAVLICALLYAIEATYIDEGVDEQIDVRELLCGSNIIASVLLVPLVVLTKQNVPISWWLSESAIAVACIALFSATAYTLFFYSIKLAGSVFASQCAYIVTISGVLWGILIFNESHSFWVWISVAVMLAGLSLVSPMTKYEKESQGNPEPEK